MVEITASKSLLYNKNMHWFNVYLLQLVLKSSQSSFQSEFYPKGSSQVKGPLCGVLMFIKHYLTPYFHTHVDSRVTHILFEKTNFYLGEENSWKDRMIGVQKNFLIKGPSSYWKTFAWTVTVPNNCPPLANSGFPLLLGSMSAKVYLLPHHCIYSKPPGVLD